MLVPDSPPVELLCYVFEQDTLSPLSSGSTQEDRKSYGHGSSKTNNEFQNYIMILFRFMTVVL